MAETGTATAVGRLVVAERLGPPCRGGSWIRTVGSARPAGEDSVRPGSPNQQVDQGARTRMLPDARAVVRSVEAAPTPPQGLPSSGA